MHIEKAERLRKLPPYLFAEIDKAKNEAKEQGKDIIDLGVGDPDKPTPMHIIQRLYEAAKDPSTHCYALDFGLLELRKAFVEGRLIGILIILFGVAVVGAVTGRIASFLVEKQLKAGQGLSSLQKLNGHFIICGYKREITLIILDILKVNPELKMDKIVLISTVDPQKINDLKADRSP